MTSVPRKIVITEHISALFLLTLCMNKSQKTIPASNVKGCCCGTTLIISEFQPMYSSYLSSAGGIKKPQCNRSAGRYRLTEKCLWMTHQRKSCLQYCLGKYMAHLKSDKQVLISACDGKAQSLQLEVCLKRKPVKGQRLRLI